MLTPPTATYLVVDESGRRAVTSELESFYHDYCTSVAGIVQNLTYRFNTRSSLAQWLPPSPALIRGCTSCSANGDNLVSCTYNGSETPAGDRITIQQ
jgi:hypothetical protein